MTIVSCYTKEAFKGVWAVNDFTGRTDKGIRMGASKSEIIEAYGEPDEQTNRGGLVILEYKKLRISFNLKDDQLIQIFAFGPRPARKD